MIETTVPEAISLKPPCPSCGRPLAYQENEKTWRCLACNPIPMNAPICATQKCKRPLTKLGPPQNCWRCLVCNPIVEVKPTEMPEKKYIDVTVTKEMVRDMIKEAGADEEKIREIIRDELADWHINRPPITKEEISETIPPSSGVPKPETYMQKAKRLGVPTHKPEGGIRKKADVLADIARLTKPSPEGDKENPSATMEKGA